MAALRFPTKEKASVEIYGKAGKLFADLANISRTGACLEYPIDDTPVRRGDLLRLTVELPNVGRRHFISAEVVWRTGKRTGVLFLKPEELLDRMVGREA